MDNTALTPEIPTTKGSKHFKAAIDTIFAQLAVSDVRIANDQAEIDRLKAQTRTLLAELQAVL
jgi:uncharacterized small protein (DUF1192 family)